MRCQRLNPRFVIICLGLCAACSSAYAQTAAAGATKPLQVQLIAPLDVTHLHPGTTFFARVMTPWTQQKCLLTPGNMVRGHVIVAAKRTRSLKISSLELAIDQADCKGDPERSPRFTIVAVVGSPPPNDGMSEGAPLANDLPLGLSSGGGANGGAGRRMSSATAITDNMPIPSRNMPSSIRPGDVVDLPRIHLELRTGEDRDATFTAKGRDLRFEPGTVFILLPTFKLAPAPETHMQMVGTGAAINVAPSADHVRNTVGTPVLTFAPAEPPDSTAICSEGCTTQAPGAITSHGEESRADSVVSLASFGLVPPGPREMTGFGQEANLFYLDNTHLLCTFDPHLLRQRTKTSGEPAITIRAVVVNTKLHQIERVLNWHVYGTEQYLWRFSSNHLLVHVGKKLQELDADLTPLRSIPLDGRLAWVSVSPAGDHLAVGIVNERYSEAFHQQLQEALPEDPEEDIAIHVYDRNFHLVMTTLRSSHAPVPVLSGDGETHTRRERVGRWQISRMNWNLEDRPIATAHTACRPDLVSLPDDLLFMLGCNSTGARWYRVLHRNGRPVLKAESDSNELEQAAQGSTSGLIAIRTVITAKSFGLGQPFSPADLLEQHITLYSETNGARITTISSPDFATEERNFALSPDGKQVAVLGHTSVRLYAVPPQKH